MYLVFDVLLNETLYHLHYEFHSILKCIFCDKQYGFQKLIEN